MLHNDSRLFELGLPSASLEGSAASCASFLFNFMRNLQRYDLLFTGLSDMMQVINVQLFDSASK